MKITESRPAESDELNALLSYILLEYIELTDKERFRTAVRLAKLILKPKLNSDESLPERLAMGHMEFCELGAEDISIVVDELIYVTQQGWTQNGQYGPEVAYDTLICLASLLHRQHKDFPKNLHIWTADFLNDTVLDNAKKKRPRPTLRGRKKNTNLTRDEAFQDAHEELCGLGFSPTRYIVQKGEEYTDCCFEGGSIIDIIGLAYEELTGKKISYKTLEGNIRHSRNRWNLE